MDCVHEVNLKVFSLLFDGHSAGDLNQLRTLAHEDVDAIDADSAGPTRCGRRFRARRLQKRRHQHPIIQDRLNSPVALRFVRGKKI